MHQSFETDRRVHSASRSTPPRPSGRCWSRTELDGRSLVRRISPERMTPESIGREPQAGLNYPRARGSSTPAPGLRVSLSKPSGEGEGFVCVGLHFVQPVGGCDEVRVGLVVSIDVCFVSDVVEIEVVIGLSARALTSASQRGFAVAAARSVGVARVV